MPEPIVSDADLEKQVQALDVQITDLRGKKKALVSILAERGQKAHEERMAKGNVLTPTAPKG